MTFSWDTILAADEKIQKEFTISLRYRKAVLGIVILLSVAALFVSWYAAPILLLFGGFYWWYVNTAKHYAITNRRIVMVTAFLTRDIVSIDFNEITDIELEQSVIDQLGKWGTIVINTAGTHVPEVRLSYIDSPALIKQDLDAVRDKTTAVPQQIPQTPQA